jgi:anti-anti-sigma factor
MAHNRPTAPLNGFVITEARENGSVQLALRGELDIATLPQLEDALERTREASLLTLDLSALDFMDSSGLRIILAEHARAQEAGRKLSIVRGPAAVHRVFELTGTAELLPIVDRPEA